MVKLIESGRRPEAAMVTELPRHNLKRTWMERATYSIDEASVLGKAI